MKMSLQEVYDRDKGMEIYQRDGACGNIVGLAMKMGRTALRPTVTDAGAQIDEMIKKFHGKKLSNGAVRIDDPEDRAAFQKEYDEFMKTEVEIEIKPIPRSRLMLVPPFKGDGLAQQLLGDLINEDVDPADGTG